MAATLRDNSLNELQDVTFDFPDAATNVEENVKIDVELMELYLSELNTKIAMYEKFLQSEFLSEERRQRYASQKEKLKGVLDNLKNKIRAYDEAHNAHMGHYLESRIIRTELDSQRGGRKRRTRRLRNTLRRNRRTHAVK